MTLCANRPDGGFGPYYTLRGGHRVLSTCFDDIILLPIGSWLFILLTVAATALFWSRRRRYPASVPSATGNKHNDTELLAQSSDRQSASIANGTRVNNGKGPKPRTRRAFLILTTLFLIALIAMHALEIARLSANHQGIGLIPFLFVPLVVVIASLYVPAPGWSHGGWIRPARPHGVPFMAIVTLWALATATTEGVKLWSLSSVYNSIGRARYNGNNSKYPYSDKITDISVIVAVYVVGLICYLVTMLLEHRRWRQNTAV